MLTRKQKRHAKALDKVARAILLSCFLYHPPYWISLSEHECRQVADVLRARRFVKLGSNTARGVTALRITPLGADVIRYLGLDVEYALRRLD